MRTTKLFATFLVAGLIASACAQDPDYVLPAIKVESEELNFSAETEQALVFTATRDWRVQSKPDWVTVVPDQGSGSGTSQRVNICVAANPDYNRSGEVVLTIGLDKAHVAVIQPGAKGEIPVGSGTQEDPYTVTGVLRYIATLGADVESENDVYVTGTISAVTEAYSAQYGNATFEMTSDSGEKFTFYRGLYLGNKKWTANDTQIKVGDAVVVCGKVINFKGNTPETQQNKAYLYSLNGETQGTGGGGGSTTEVKVVTVAQFNAAPDSDTQKYQLTGKVSGNINSTYGNFDLVDDTGTVYVYGLTKTDLGYGATNDKSFESLGLKAGDTVTIIGYRKTYKKEGQDDKIEVVYAYYVSHTAGSGDSGGGQSGGDTTTQVKTVTVAEFLAAADSKTQKYQLTGVVSGTVNETYGNFDLKDDSGTVYVYGLTKTELGYGATNDKSFASLGLKAGDTVTLIGYRGTYKKEGQDDKPEVMYAYYVSHTPAN